MGKMTPVAVEVSETDLADLEEWARNSERSVADLLREALRQYVDYMRDEDAMFEEADKGPFYTMDEVKAHLAEDRARLRSELEAQAAEQAQAAE